MAASEPGDVEPYWPLLRSEVWQRDRGRCRLCGEQVGERGVIHHIRLRSQGGGHEPENLALLHPRCHLWVHDNPSLSRDRGLYGV